MSKTTTIVETKKITNVDGTISEITKTTTIQGTSFDAAAINAKAEAICTKGVDLTGKGLSWIGSKLQNWGEKITK